MSRDGASRLACGPLDIYLLICVLGATGPAMLLAAPRWPITVLMIASLIKYHDPLVAIVFPYLGLLSISPAKVEVENPSLGGAWLAVTPVIRLEE